MSKILFVPDVADWAIGHLVSAKARNISQESKIIPIHPRDAKEKASWFLEEVKKYNPDIICYEYFRSAEQLINAQPELKQYTSVLVHHNQRDKALFHADWNELGIDKIVTHTNKCRRKLNEHGYSNVVTINHGIDVHEFSYRDKEPEELMIGYVGRIVPWKGLKEVAEVAQELGYPVQVMGKIDKVDYWNEIPKDNLRFDYFDCSDEERIEAYHSMTIYVGNSEDDYEEGTLPYLEAMACGVPVVTTPNGVANDKAVDGENALVVPFKNKEALKVKIKQAMEDKELRERLRKNAWDVVRHMTEEKMAYEYEKLFNKLLYGDEPLVSVIVPSTYNRVEETKQILDALDSQTHKAVEVLVVWDEMEVFNKIDISKYCITVRELYTERDGYNLAHARNFGAIKARGEYLMFNDNRLKPESDAIQMFIQGMEVAQAHSDKKTWLFGDKGSQKKSFVENFSFVKRKDFTVFGMMPEWINRYGGLSQEVRTRWVEQGGAFEYVGQANAEQLRGSSMNKERRDGIVDMKFLLYTVYEDIAH